MPAEEQQVVLYPAVDRKDQWTHVPAGGTEWEHLKKVGVFDPEVPAESPRLTSIAEQIATVEVEPYVVPAGWEIVKMEARTYMTVAGAGKGTAGISTKGLAGFGAELAWTAGTGWRKLAATKLPTATQLKEITLTCTNKGIGAANEATMRSYYLLLTIRKEEEEPPPPPPPVGGSVPRGKTGTPRYRGNLHAEFPIDVVEEERHYGRTLARFLFGLALAVLIVIAAWGLFNSWGDAAVIKTVETIGEKV